MALESKYNSPQEFYVWVLSCGAGRSKLLGGCLIWLPGILDWLYIFLHAMRDNPCQQAGCLELTWTLQTMHDLTGKCVPHYWDIYAKIRPTSVMQNCDTSHWSLTTNSTTLAKNCGQFKTWLVGFQSGDDPRYWCSILEGSKSMVLTGMLITSETNRFGSFPYDIWTRSHHGGIKSIKTVHCW